MSSSSFFSAHVAARDRSLSELDLAQLVSHAAADFRLGFELSATPSAVVATDGRIVRVNRSLANLLERAAEDLVGQSIDLFIHTDDLARMNLTPSAIVQRGPDGLTTAELRLMRPDDSPIPVRMTVHAIRHGDSNCDSHGEGTDTVKYHLCEIVDRTLEERARALFESNARADAEVLRRHSTVFQEMSEAVIVVSEDLEVLEVNPAASALFGMTHEQMIGPLRGNPSHPHSPLGWGLRTRENLRLHEGHWRHQVNFVDGTGRRRVADVISVHLHDDVDEPVGFVAVYRDVTEREERAAHIRQLEDQWRRTFEAAPIGMVVIAVDGEYLHANRAFTNFTGYTLNELAGMRKLSSVVESSREDLATFPAAFLSGETDQLQLDRRVRRKNAEPTWASVSISAVRDRDGSLLHFVAFIEDIAHRRAHTERLMDLANRDSLTGLANRSAFMATLAHALTVEGEALALGFMDLDGFKAINDEYGHQTGDELLRYVARRIDTGLRNSDTAGRIGGDEFALLLTPIAEDSLHTLAERLVLAMAQPFALERTTVTISASLGIVRLNRLMSPERALRLADEAMYESKSAGKNRFTIR